MARYNKGDNTADLGTVVVESAMDPTAVWEDSDILIPPEGNKGVVFRVIPLESEAGYVQIFGYDKETDTEWPEGEEVLMEAIPTLGGAGTPVPVDIQVFPYCMGPCFARLRNSSGGAEILGTYKVLAAVME